MQNNKLLWGEYGYFLELHNAEEPITTATNQPCEFGHVNGEGQIS